MVDHVILENDTQIGAQLIALQGLNIHSIQENLSSCWFIQTGQQFNQGGLASAIFTNESNSFPWLNNKADIVEHRPDRTRVDKGNMAELKARRLRSGKGSNTSRGTRSLNMRFRGQKIKKTSGKQIILVEHALDCHQ